MHVNFICAPAASLEHVWERERERRERERAEKRGERERGREEREGEREIENVRDVDALK